jgi:uncharacterized protein (TIGR03085 family)
MTSLAKRERVAISQLLRKLGPDAPTLCEGWNSFDLLVHLVSRETRPDAAIGLVVPALSSYTSKVAQDIKSRGFENLITEFEHGPKRTSFFALPGVDNLANSFEFLIHHEDLLRGQPDYSPRTLDEDDKKLIWKRFTQSGKLLMRKAKVGIIAQSDQGTYTIKSGNSCVTMKGEVIDLLLFAYGRKAHVNIEFEGEESAIRILKETKFGF